VQVKNKVMFMVEVGSVLTTLGLVQELLAGTGWPLFTGQVAFWLCFTVLFANVAEAMADGRGKAQADTLRKTRTETVANRVASVGESAITGESAPVIRESAGDRSAVPGGTRAANYRTREGLEPALIPERVMVCMSSNALAPRVLRTGARIAGRLGSRWYAVYVETPSERGDRINPRDAEALQQNIKLAETLGATVVRVKADKPADGLIAFAQREGVTHVIFGQSARTRWELLVRGSTLDKFLSAVPGAAVQVVPLTET